MPYLIVLSSFILFFQTPTIAKNLRTNYRSLDTSIIEQRVLNRKINTKEVAENGSLNASNKINKGIKAIMAGDAKNALKQLHKVSRNCDDYWKVLNARGVLLMERNQPLTALTLFYEALKLAPTDNHLMYNIALANLALGNYQAATDTLKLVSSDNSVNYQQALALTYYKNDQFDNAKKLLEEELEKPSDNVENYNSTLLNHAHVSIKQGDTESALTSLDKIKSKDDPIVALSYGICYEKRGAWESALEFYTKAQEKLPRNKSVILGLAHAFKGLGDSLKANLQIRKLNSIYPDAIESQIESFNKENLSNADKHKTIEFYKQILAKNPENLQALNSLGMLYTEYGNYSAAKIHFSQVLSFQPENVLALYGQGICEFYTDDFNPSVEHLLSALQHSPNFEKHGSAEFVLGLDYDALKKYELSVNILKKAVVQTNQVNELTRLIKIGLFYLRIKKFKDAISYFQNVATIDPKNVANLVNRGSCYFWLGDFNNAKKDFENAIKLDPKCHEAWSNLGLLHCQLKENNLAVDELKKAISIDTNNVLYYNSLARAYSALLSDYRDLNPEDTSSKYFKLALKTIDKVLQKDPNNSNFINNKGVVFKDNLQYETAISYYRKSETQAGLNNIGIIKTLQYDTVQSKVYFDRAIAADASFSIPRHNKALMKDFLNDAMTAQIEGASAEKLKTKEALTKSFRENFISIYYVETVDKNQTICNFEAIMPSIEPESMTKPLVANYYVHGSYIVCDEVKDYKTPKWHDTKKPSRRTYFQFMSGKCPKF